MENIAASKLNQILLGVILASIVLGLTTGYVLATKSSRSGGLSAPSNNSSAGAPKTASQDTKTFKDFAEGTVQKKPTKGNDQYVEGTHILVRSDNPIPVTLTSSVLDLDQYVGKKVKVYGETQKAVKEGWLMDVGKVEVE